MTTRAVDRELREAVGRFPKGRPAPTEHEAT